MTEPDTSPRAGRPLVVAALTVAAVWLVVVVAWRPAPFALTFDDAYYYFGIARNLAHGHGSTFDGIDPTNGYHPLWMLMCVPVFALGLDGLAAVRVLLVIQVLLWGAALVVVARLVGRAIDGWPRLDSVTPTARRWCSTAVVAAFVLVMANPFVVKVFVNGLESGVAVLLYALVLHAAVHARGRWLSAELSSRWRLGTSVLLALVFLARTDALFLIACLGIWCLAEARAVGRPAIVRLTELFAVPMAIVITYIISNQAWFGLPVQISGLVKRAQLTPGRIILLSGAVLVGVVLGTAARRIITSTSPAEVRRRFPRVRTFFGATGWFAAFCVLVVTYYNVAQTQQWLWYYCPCVLYLAVLLVLGVADFAESALLEAPTGRSAARVLSPLLALLLGPLVVAFVFQYRTFADPHLRSILETNHEAGEWIDRALPTDAVLGSWDAGVVGYFSHRSVINLDGVANSYAYYQAGRSGQVGAFLEDRRLGWLVNHGEAPTGEPDPSFVAFARENLSPGAAAGMTLRQSWPFLFSGVTTGSGGSKTGLRELAVLLYQLGSTAERP